MALSQKQTQKGNKIEDPEIDPHSYSPLIFDGVETNTEEKPLQQMALGKLGIHMGRNEICISHNV